MSPSSASRPPRAHSRRGHRRLLSFLVIAFWLVMTVFLLDRELGFFERQAAPVAVGGLTEERQTWLGLFLASGQRVGHVHLREAPAERRGRAGVELSMAARADLDLLGRRASFEIDGEVFRPHAVREADFSFAVRSADHDFRVSGRVADGALRGEIRSAGETLPLEMPLDSDSLFTSGFGPALAVPDLEIGEEIRLVGFDPLTLEKSPLRLRAVARETLELEGGPVETRRLAAVSGVLRSEVWIDDEGEVVQATTPIGLTLRRIAPVGEEPSEDDKAAAAAEGAGGLLEMTAVVPRGARPFRGARESLLRITAPRPLPEDDTQVRAGEGLYRVRAATTTDEPAPSVAATSSPDLAVDLAADVFVQAAHPEIVARAAEIVGPETDPWRRAVAIHDWVYREIDKEPVMSVPSALEVLAQRRGDCNEHTVLYTALARAAGLPTRIAIGLVWSDELGGFYYHAWPEVHVADRWVWVDPTLGQPRADATHLKLLNGGIERWMELLPFIGQLEIEVLEIR